MKKSFRLIDNDKYKIQIRLFWASFLIGICLFIGVFIYAALGYMGEMPPLEQLENPKTNLATQILSSDGVVLGKFYYNDNRTPITYEELPTNIVQALIATEDERYYDHSGIDWYATLRAIYFLGKRGGASTITQQLARQLFVGVRSRNKKEAIIQKIKEWVLSIQLERRYTKEEIIAMYLNIYDFGYNADGVRSAAKIFFNSNPENLTVEQSATLVGMLQNSSLYNPIRRPELVKKRRNVVFQQMYRNQLLTQEEKDSLSMLNLEIKFTPESHREGACNILSCILTGFYEKMDEKKL